MCLRGTLPLCSKYATTSLSPLHIQLLVHRSIVSCRNRLPLACPSRRLQFPSFGVDQRNLFRMIITPLYLVCVCPIRLLCLDRVSAGASSHPSCLRDVASGWLLSPLPCSVCALFSYVLSAISPETIQTWAGVIWRRGARVTWKPSLVAIFWSKWICWFRYLSS